jgi:hypothetical protein
MHEFKHGEFKHGAGGKGGKVKSRRQAIAIALKEAGASQYESRSENRRNLARTKRKEARGETYQQTSTFATCQVADAGGRQHRADLPRAGSDRIRVPQRARADEREHDIDGSALMHCSKVTEPARRNRRNRIRLRRS